MKIRRRQRKAPDFSLATINIVFLLLLFFVVAGTITAPKEAAIDLPTTVALPLERLPRPLLVIEPNGQLILDGSSTALDDIASTVRSGPSQILHILVPAKANANVALAPILHLAAQGIETRLVTIRQTQ